MIRKFEDLNKKKITAQCTVIFLLYNLTIVYSLINLVVIPLQRITYRPAL